MSVFGAFLNSRKKLQKMYIYEMVCRRNRPMHNDVTSSDVRKFNHRPGNDRNLGGDLFLKL